jgi:uncharacterized protein YaiI (UPF0178 family)
MNIFVDADACPVKEIIVNIAKKFNIPVFMFIDTSHILKDDYATIITVDKANDSVDFAIANKIKKGDIAITQDYGLASMLLGKGAYVIHQNGFSYTADNIDQLLFERHMSKKARRSGVKSHHHIKARTKEDDLKFEKNFYHLVESLVTK